MADENVILLYQIIVAGIPLGGLLWAAAKVVAKFNKITDHDADLAQLKKDVSFLKKTVSQTVISLDEHKRFCESEHHQQAQMRDKQVENSTKIEAMERKLSKL